MSDINRIGSSTTIRDPLGTAPVIGIFGERLATGITDDVLVKFVYNVSSYDVTTSVANGGTVTQADSMAVLQTSTATNGSASVESKAFLRYRSGRTALSAFTALFQSGGVAGATQYAGIFDDDDGIYLGYNGVDRVVGYRHAGVDVQVVEADWNGDSRVQDYTWDALNVFRICFGWLGAAPILFQVCLPGTSEWVAIHVVQEHGVLAKPHIGVPATPIRFEVIKTSGATNIVVKTGSWQAGVMGTATNTGSRPFQHGVVKTLAANTDVQTVINFKSATTFQGKANRVASKLLRYQFHTSPPASGSGTITYTIIENPVLAGTPSYTDIDSDNSVMSYDTTATYSSGGTEKLAEFQDYNAQGNSRSASTAVVDAASLGLFLDPTNTYTITAQNSSAVAVTVRLTLNWVELF